MIGGGGFSAQFQESLLEFAEIPLKAGTAGDQDHGTVARQMILPAAKHLPETAFDAIPVHCRSDSPGSNQPEARRIPDRSLTSFQQKVSNERAAIHAHPLFANPPKLGGRSQMLARKKAHRKPSWAKPGQAARRLRPLRRRAARILRPARVAIRARKPNFRALLSFDGL